MDKRKFNGGNSTKAKGVDKRKNEYKQALSEALTKDDIIDNLRMLHKKSIKDEDTAAAKIILSYYLGNPKDSVDITSDGDSLSFPIINFTKGAKD